jgi:hypothetical protein
MAFQRSRQRGFRYGLSRPSGSPRLEADRFFADLYGIQTRPRRAAVAQPPMQPAAPPSMPSSGVASWERPDLIFDSFAHHAPHEAEAMLGELIDEGWGVVASPRSFTHPSTLRRYDVVVQRAMGDGKLAFIRVLGQDIDVSDLYGPGGLIRADTLVLRSIGEGVEPGEDVTPAREGDAGEVIVNLPLLGAHAARGFPKYDVSGANCVLRWTRVPRNYSGPLDVVVHFHGYAGHNTMTLQRKAAASGLDLQSPGVTRPTLGVVPHGRAFTSRLPDTDGFDFPAIATRETLKRFIDAAVTAFKSSIGSTDRAVNVDRVILTGHSGGGAPLNVLMRSIGTNEGVHAFHYFDATYGGTPLIADERGWLPAAMRRDAQALQAVSGDAERTRIMRERGGGLRILFIDGSGTAATAHAVDRFIAAKLRELVPDEGLRNFLRRYYRAQKVANPRAVGHNKVPGTFGGRLLADGGHSLDADARDLVMARAPTEDAPTAAPDAAAAGALEKVRTTIEATLQSFRNIVVTVPAPTGRDVAVQTPYVINRPTSPSMLRAQEKRPGLLRNDAIARAFNALPNRAKIGKAYVADIKTFLQSTVDANAVPGQANGLSAAALKSFLSDAGVGVDCSGFVSQALNACMTALGRGSVTIDTNSANLRGGTGHNSRQFDVIARPADLCPGDTMWKTGHIRIISKVEPQADGSIQFITAESSSVDLVGPVAKTWKCPQAARFTGVQVERGGTFRPNTETNVYSRYKPLAEAMRGTQPTAAPPAPATTTTTTTATTTKEDQPSAPTAAPTASRPAAAPPPPAPPPPASGAAAGAAAGAVAGAGAAAAVAVPTTLTQPEIDRLDAIKFANATDIDTFFSRKGASGFIGWFNATWAGRAPFRRGNSAIRLDASAAARQRFTAFWNSIPTAYDRASINALDFASLMSIVLNETGGDFAAHPERCGAGRTDARGPHPGLAYAFDKIVKVKSSYNTLRGNRRAGDLFNDADYVRVHGNLGSATRLANKGSEFGNAWNSEFYPQNEFSTAEDLTQNGFIMQADFYKFRGRGVIQTTSRAGYLRVVSYIQGYTGSNTVLTDFKRKWTGMTRDVAATISTNADWDAIFSQGEVLARAVRLHSTSDPAQDYLRMDTRAATLLNVPAKLATATASGTPGSIYFMGRRVSGSYDYGAGIYRERVLGMLNGILAL